ncbi:BamA/TamA family outer membrane protein [Algoriphagus marinus]|uniref:BamA/TamA family outer membrane protein n=1 Tax=Algoriphagus marinus TaxID=1925762 RepID=UPI0009FAC152|nr:BamA/TamA family outer membrane protein [Algoriphagus marinus]
METEFLDSLQTIVRNEGYLEAFFKEERRSDSLFVEILLGKKYLWKAIGTENVPSEFSRSLNPIGKNFNSALVWMQNVVSEAENQGFPFAKMNFGEIVVEGDSIRSNLVFDSGPLILWDSVEVTGNTKTQGKYIQNLTGIIPGSPFSQKQLDQASRQLRRSPYFSLTREPSLSFQIKKARPTFELKDRNTNVLDGIVGLLPNENEPGKMLITGQLDLELYHLGGKGRDVEIHWQRLNLQSQSLDISAKESFLFNSPIDVQLGFNLLKQDTTFLNRYLSLDFGYRISSNSYLNFFSKRQAGDLISTFAFREVTELPDVADFRWNQYGISLHVNSLEDPFIPRRGGLLNLELAAGNKKILQNTGIPDEVYSGIDFNTPQYQIQGSYEKHFFIGPTWGMWFKGSGGLIQNENLLLNDLFRLGGLKTIRGFNENFFYARSFGYLSMEQRLFFGENSFLMVFADAGILENPYFATAIDRPVSFGAGLNLETGSGLFRFIYGVGKSNLQPLQFSYSRIHFGYLARF